MRQFGTQKENLISRERIYKKRGFFQKHFGERNIILEQLSDRTPFFSRILLNSNLCQAFFYFREFKLNFKLKPLCALDVALCKSLSCMVMTSRKLSSLFWMFLFYIQRQLWYFLFKKWKKPFTLELVCFAKKAIGNLSVSRAYSEASQTSKKEFLWMQELKSVVSCSIYQCKIGNDSIKWIWKCGWIVYHTPLY